jgi:hypothetical protein
MLKIDQFRKIISAHKIISSVVLIMIALGATGQIGSHISSAQINTAIQSPCLGSDGKPQLFCPPLGKCLGPADEPIPCPKPSTKPGGGIETGCGGPNDMCPQPNPTAGAKNTKSLQIFHKTY